MNQEEKIKQFRQVQIQLLQEFDMICRENKLTYWLDAGTLLGAIRHHGDFIPWDDDVDIAMPYEDYQRLIALYENKQTWKNFRLIAPEYGTEKEIAKLLDISCKVTEQTPSEIRESFAFVDIFPLVSVDKNKSIRTRYYTAGSLLLAAHLNTYSMHIRIPAILARGVYRLFGEKRFYAQLEKFYQREENKQGSYFTYHWRAPFGCPYFEKAWFEETEVCDFQGLQLNIPKGWEAILIFLYKDYKSYPPVEEQVFPHIIDFTIEDSK